MARRGKPRRHCDSKTCPLGGASELNTASRHRPRYCVTLALAAGLLCACGDANQPPAPPSVSYTSDAVDECARILQRGWSPLPSEVIEAHLIGVQRGAYRSFAPGPTDFVLFLSARVPIDSIDRWLQPLTARPAPVRQDFPPGNPAWWPSETAFSALEFFDLATQFPDTSGWIGVARASGTLYIVSMTL